MIAEARRFLRRLTNPMRRSFWRSRRETKLDAPGVLMVCFDQASQKERTRLLKRYGQYRRQPLQDNSRPLGRPDERQVGFWHRFVLFFLRTTRCWRALMAGSLPWSVHLCESEALAVAEAQLARGEPVVVLADLRAGQYGELRRLEAALSHFEHRRYESWVIFRDRQEAFVPAGLAFPEEPLTVAELEQLARARSHPEHRADQLNQVPPAEGALRVMTYNVHSCVGLDGRLSVRRIAEVLERYSPHFVAIQELDCGCRRTEGMDQLAELARLWPSTAMFCPAMDRNGGQYGIGCLSRLPVRDWESTTLSPGKGGEPRVAMRVECEWGQQTVHFFNTHLGLTRGGRRKQLDLLISALQAVQGIVILAGDLNCPPASPVHRRLTGVLEETQERPKRTWFGANPIRVLDYTLFRGPLEVTRSIVPRDALTRVASDHLPLLTDFRLKPSRQPPPGSR